jgi:DNA-binding SARP family transcriptional activator
MRANDERVQALKPRMLLLGRCRLALSGRELTAPGRKARGMLAFLALAPGNSASREQLAGLLWSDRGQDQARASLRQTLKELRELPLVGEAVATGRDVVALDSRALAIDLLEIRDAAAARDLSGLASLLDDVRGDLVEDLTDLSPAFEEWVQAERPRQHDLVIADSLDAVAAGGLTDMKDTRSILRSLDRIDPVNEGVVRLGMRLDHAVGDGASLHRRYRQLCDRLENEFGALPSEETRALFHALAANRDEPAAAPPARAPPEPARVRGDLLPLVMVAPLQAAASEGSLPALADLCTDDIRVSLSRMRTVHVLAVGDAALPEVLARSEDALGIYLLSGSLRTLGGETRANLQLADAANRIILWSDSLRFEETDGAMLEAIVGKAAGAVLPAIDRDLNRRLRESEGEFDGERALFARARLLIRSPDGLPAVAEGVRLLESVAAANPRHLAARMLLFRLYATDFWQLMTGHDVRRFRETSEEHLQAAAAVEPGSYAVRIGQAWCHVRNGRTAPAKREFETALAQLPHDAEAANMCAMGMLHLALLDEAERLMQRAFDLNPFPPSDYHADFALTLAVRGDHQAAEEHFAVSGETGLLYTAIRIANAAGLGWPAEQAARLVADFTSHFRQAWQPRREPTLHDVLEWIGYALPLHSPESMAWLRGGLERMLAPTWPEAPGSDL